MSTGGPTELLGGHSKNREYLSREYSLLKGIHDCRADLLFYLLGFSTVKPVWNINIKVLHNYLAWSNFVT